MDHRQTRPFVSLTLRLALLAGGLPASAFAGVELFWYDDDGSTRRVQRCDVASCAPADFATSVGAGLHGDVAIDPIEGVLYWAAHGTNAGTSKVQRKSLSGGGVEDIFDLSSVAGSYPITGMAVDPVARQVYLATPSTSTRIRRFSIDSPTTSTPVALFSEAGCACSPQGLALDLANGFLYWADLNNGKIARKALDLASPIQDVVTGLGQPVALALDVANDRVYFSQTTPNRVSYALLSSPTTVVDLVNPLPTQLFAGGLERDPTAGSLGELYVALTGNNEIRHCDLDAGCPTPLVLLTGGMTNDRGMALLLASSVPALSASDAAWLALLLSAAAWLAVRRGRITRPGLP
jgi:hypothetical protein